MNQEKYNLNWHSYSDHLREMLHEMMRSNELTDVTLVCDDKKQFKAHKIVLSACSSVFKSIINELPQNNSVIYLRGIQHQEIESILEFMYLGAATFYQDRMNEFLNVAKNLQIKEISKDVEFDYENGSNTAFSDHYTDEESKPPRNTNEDRNADSAESLQLFNNKQLQRSSDGSFACDQCAATFTNRGRLNRHFQSIHEGVKYACHQCDYRATQQASLTRHIKSMHEFVKYPCNQCDYKATEKSTLTKHIKSMH